MKNKQKTVLIYHILNTTGSVEVVITSHRHACTLVHACMNTHTESHMHTHSTHAGIHMYEHKYLVHLHI